MSFESKRRAVMVFLVCLAVWPLAHRFLVTRFEISPWRLGGWAMYCTPKLRVEVGIVPESNGKPIAKKLPEELQTEASDFVQRRAVLGRFADPRSLALNALDKVDADSVVITIQHNRLDPRTDTIVGRREYFRYRRIEHGLLVERFDVRELP